ncbi:MAG: divalent-cation tolerance protein CutA, partial [Candidatus Omnitrophica bacterium]|nr:divalent-cation tolerance protein CutA [Candidatus Omnitrophota bacterium]
DTAKEALLVIKTKNSNFSKLEKLIKSIHPYIVPEIIAFKIDKINKKYFSWLIKESSG